MSSQEDMFATQEQEPKKLVKYDFVVLCDQDDNVQHPFASFPRTMFSSAEILDKWMESILDHSSRLKPLTTLQRMSKFSLFGKIEEGTNIYFAIILQ